MIEADRLDQIQGAAELGIALPWEGHDHVGADRRIRHPLANAVDDAAVAVHRVAPGHCPQHVVVAALEGDVEVLAQLGEVGAGVDQAFGEVAGVARGEADAGDPVHVVHRSQQVGEGVGAAALRGDAGQVASIGVDVLAQQGDLPKAAGRQALHFQPDGLGQPALFPPPHGRHHAVGAALIAAVDHIHPGAHSAVPAGRGDVLEDGVLLGGHHLLAALDPLQQAGETVGVLGAHHQIQFGHPPEQRFPLLLGHAAGHHQGEVGVGPFAQGLPTQVAIDLLLRVVADGAGVVKHQIGAVFVAAGGVAHGLEDAPHPLRVRLVHLAAEGGDPVTAAESGPAHQGPRLRVHPGGAGCRLASGIFQR